MSVSAGTDPSLLAIVSGVLGSAITGGLVVVLANEVLRRWRLPRLRLHYENRPEYCARTPFDLLDAQGGEQRPTAGTGRRAEGQTASTTIAMSGSSSASQSIGVYHYGKTDTHNSGPIVVTPSDDGVEAIYLRVKVTNSKPKTFAANCRAYITRVVRTNPDGTTTNINSQDALRIPWSLSDPDVDAMDIPSGINQFADVCYTISKPPYSNKLYCAARRFPFRLSKVWDGVGEFEVTVMVTADHVAPVTQVIRFEWRGAWESLQVVAR